MKVAEKQTTARRSKKLSIFIAVCLLLFVVGYITVSIYETNVLTTSPSRKPGPYNPKDYGLAFEEVQFQSAATDHLNLKGWWIPHPESSRVLILVHVKNGDRSFPLPMSKPLWEKGFN